MPGASRKKAVTAHFIAHWGVPGEIHVQENSRFDLAVIEFAPARGRVTHRFATNGMSAVVQSSPGGRYRTELFASSRSGDPWIVRLLAALAAYPIEEETSLGELQSVPLCGPIVREGAVFTAVVIAPPGPEDPESMGTILRVTPEPILVHQVVAISDQELNFAVERGGEAVWRRLLGLGRPLLLDEARPDAARGSA